LRLCRLMCGKAMPFRRALFFGPGYALVSGLSANDSVILSPPAELKDQDPIEVSAP